MTELVLSTQLAQAVDCVDAETGASLRAAFDSMFAQADDWVRRAASIKITSEDQTREMKFARESRLALREIRVNAEKTRKKLKADSLLRSRAIDGIYNVIAALIEPVEEHLLEQETFAERQAEKRRDLLREARKQTLVAFGANPATYADLGLMADDAWSQVVDAARSARDARVTRERELREAAEAAAAKAAADAEERRVQEAERERAAADERVRLEREATEAKRVAADERAAREKAETDARAERERQEAERRKADADAQAARIRQEAEAARLRREVDEANARAEAEKVAREKAERAAVAPRTAAPLRGPSLPASDAVQATLTATGKEVLDVFTRARLEPSEALMVLARLAGLVETMCVNTRKVRTTIDDLHDEFCERVATEREVMFKLASEKRASS
jgi:hypothetical protein